MRHTKQIACLDLNFFHLFYYYNYTLLIFLLLAGLKLTHFDDQKERGREVGTN